MWTKTAMVIRPCNCYLQRWYLLAGELPTTALWCSPSVPSCEAAHLSWVGFVIVGILVIVVIKVMVIVVINIMISAFFTIIIIGLFCKYSGSWALVGLLRSGQFSRTFSFFQIILPGRSGAKGTALLDVFFFANYPLSWALLALLQSGQFSTTVIFSNKIDYSGFVCCKQDGPVGRFVC